ncbi:phage portal protein [Granulibacter bethesdensis]|uniref:phage portal protein n=1 Tax=Granulibacter bethesdensis TaxID=364410 RepID=UPI0003F1CC1C|nr:phage portal protein [Granulibacter bethesdensis]AHJ66361.1 Portal protein [Granulibacter bethesdensis CGDNIH4]
MGFFGRLFHLERREKPYDVHDLYRDLTAGSLSQTGLSVNWQNALDVATVLACGRVLSEDVGGLPLGVYQRSGSRRIPLFDSPLQKLLDRPNDWQTGEEFRELLTLYAVLTGNGVAYKHIVGGELRELLPLVPGWYSIERQPDWSIRYRVTLPDGHNIVLTSDQVLHLHGPVWDSVSGLDIVRVARDAIGLSMAAEQAHADMHRNGAQTSGLYSMDGTLDDAGYKRLSAMLESRIAGINRFRTLILDRGAKYTPISMTGVDSQHLETRKHQIEEIARAFRVFTLMIGHAGDQSPTFASAEQFFLAHVKFSLLPWVKRWESAVARSLVPRGQTIYVRHNVAALERADIKTRYEAYQLGINAGWLLRSDVRELEELAPVSGIDRPTLPVNIAVLDGRGIPVPTSSPGPGIKGEGSQRTDSRNY